MIQESLLPGTKAIQRGTLETIPYKGGWLVRYKSLDGQKVMQNRVKTREEADVFHQKYWEELNQDVAAGKK